MNRHQFITIEGVEGAGKSTALSFIKEYFAAKHIDAVFTREPGGTPLGEDIRQLLLHKKEYETMTAETELLLMFAARAQHIKNIVSPALKAGKWVVSDRYIDASYAYQSGGRGIDPDYVQALDKWIVADCYPVLTLLMDISPEKGLQRTLQRSSGKDRIESEKIEFFERVRQGYLERAKQDPGRIRIIDAGRDLPFVHTQIASILDVVMK